MGGGHSVQSIKDIVETSITNSVTQSMQTSFTSIDASQDINVDCSDFLENIANTINACLTSAGNSGATGDDLQVLVNGCNQITDLGICVLDNVNMDMIVTYEENTGMYSKFTQAVENKLSNNVKSDLQQKTGFLEFGDSTLDYLKSLQTEITNQLESSKQDITNTIKQQQTINVTSGIAKYIDAISTSLIVVHKVLSNEGVQTALNDLSTDVSTKISQSNGGGMTIFWAILSCILGIVAISIIIYFVRKSNRQGTASITINK